MSSFIGHSLVGGAIGWIPPSSQPRWSFFRLGWVGWLIIIALLPDLDYVILALHPSANAGLRITHSLLFALGLPMLTVAGCVVAGVRGQQLWHASAQLVLAGLSHVWLDMLVGVTALPLLWPASDRLFRLPFGLLPSAGKISLFNYYFYYNLVIELGVLLPLLFCALIQQSRVAVKQKWRITFTLLLVSTYFMHWAYGLSR